MRAGPCGDRRSETPSRACRRGARARHPDKRRRRPRVVHVHRARGCQARRAPNRNLDRGCVARLCGPAEKRTGATVRDRVRGHARSAACRSPAVARRGNRSRRSHAPAEGPRQLRAARGDCHRRPGCDRADTRHSFGSRCWSGPARNRLGRARPHARNGSSGVNRMPMDTLWLLPALTCYALSAALFVFDRLSGRTQATGYAVAILGAGVVCHAFDLAAGGLQAGNIPVANFAQALSFLAWLTALAGLVMIVRLRLAVIGAFVAPAVTLALGAASLTMSSGRVVLPAPLRSIWLPIHVTLAILGYTMFVLAASVSIAYLAYESRLKSKRAISPANEGGPSLEKLDRINYRLLGWGFIMLSLAIVSGAIWADARWGHFWSWEPIESWSLAIWVLYAGLLESRLTIGWRGRRAAALTLVVFSLLVGFADGALTLVEIVVSRVRDDLARIDLRNLRDDDFYERERAI